MKASELVTVASALLKKCGIGLPAPAAPAKPRPRATKAEVDALVATVLERAKALGSAFSSTELASQLGKPVGSVSNALHKLVKSGVLKVEGTKRAARYSVVSA